MVTETKRLDDTEQPYKFDGQEANWYDWKINLLQFAKRKEFKQVYLTDTQPCDEATYMESVGR